MRARTLAVRDEQLLAPRKLHVQCWDVDLVLLCRLGRDCLHALALPPVLEPNLNLSAVNAQLHGELRANCECRESICREYGLK